MPYVSQHGRAFGFDSQHGQIQRPAFSDNFDDEEALNAASTASNIKWRGLSTISTTAAKSFTLNAPPFPSLSVSKRLVATSTSTSVATVTLASGNFLSTAGSSFSKLTFNGIGQSVDLVALSTALVRVSANAGVTLST